MQAPTSQTITENTSIAQLSAFLESNPNVSKVNFLASKKPSLGKDANIVATSQKKSKRKPDYSRFNQLAYAQRLLIEADVKSVRSDNIHRTRLCHACRSGFADTITVNISDNPDDRLATLSGVQTCGSVWACPVCARRIAVQRGREIGYTIDKMQATGHIPLMLTNTASHKKHTFLPAFIKKFSLAWRMFTQSRKWRKLKEQLGIKHSIKAIEATHNDDNGWHHHQHGIVFAHADKINSLQEWQLKYWQEQVSELWLHCLKENGLYGSPEHALKISMSGDVKKDYLSKLGMGIDDTSNLDYELSAGANKDYKGRNIWSVLESAKAGNDADADLYIEYVKAYDGKNWITYSRGLKALVDLEEMPEEEATLSDNGDILMTEPLLDISDDEYQPVRYYRAYADLLEISASSRCADTVKKFLADLKHKYNTTDAQLARARMLAQYTALDNKLTRFRLAYNRDKRTDKQIPEWFAEAVASWKELKKQLNIR